MVLETVRIAIVSLAFTTAAAAQTLPTDGSDLTVPPELRQSVHPSTPAPPARHVSRPASERRIAGKGDTRSPVRSPATHPVDFGVVVRGGSATPRVISPLGNSEAVQESGTAVGAGMRFGF
jgi:hypothetical protein